MIRAIEDSDIEAICSIYNYYIVNTIITFEEEEVSVDVMRKRVEEVTASFPWLVYEEQGRVLGYAYAGKWRGRTAYRHSAELSVYLSNDERGRGLGKKLYQTLLAELRKTDLHAVIGGVSLPNEQSQRLHESLGFKKVAEFKEVGYKFNKWIDVGYWELFL
jgi:phosphinothricin acetyltransferase